MHHLSFNHRNTTLCHHLYQIIILCCLLLTASTILTAQVGEPPTHYATTFLPKANLVIMEAGVDGQRGYFIIDTGNPFLILHESGAGAKKRVNAGFAVATKKRLVQFTLGPWTYPQQLASRVDLSHLAEKVNLPLMGIIGVDILQAFELHLDYQNTRLTFYQLDGRGNKLHQVVEALPSEVLPIYFKDYLPCITVQIDHQDFLVGLDSGAAINLFSQDHKRAILAAQHARAASIIGITEKSKAKNSSFFKPHLQVGDLTMLPTITMFTDLKALNQQLPGPDVQGILGFGFLFQHKTAINFKQRKFYIWERVRKDVGKESRAADI